MAHYVDTSALVKLVAAEPESAALRRWLGSRSRVPVTSDLARMELLRTVRRVDPEATLVARQVLDALTILTLPTDAFERAGLLAPVELRSVDALHLASALRLGDDLDGVVTYDARLAAASRAQGIAVISPV
jgi:uncharacterized protein